MRLDVPHFISANWPIKITALGLATVLWVAVAVEEPTTQLVPLRLEIQTPANRTLLRNLPPIRALYAGSARELIKLMTSPLPVISKVIPDTLTRSFFTIDLSPQDVTLASDADVALREILPRRLMVTLDDVLTKPVRVVSRVDIRVANGFELMRSGVAPESVLVVGPQAQVERIGSVFTMPAEWNNIRGPLRRTIAIDTSAFGVVRLSQYDVDVDAHVEQISERTIGGVPVVIAGGDWEAIPSTVTVTIRGALSRIGALTVDSLAATAPAATVEGAMVPVIVRVPRGLTVTVLPDSVQAQRIIL